VAGYKTTVYWDEGIEKMFWHDDNESAWLEIAQSGTTVSYGAGLALKPQFKDGYELSEVPSGVVASADEGIYYATNLSSVSFSSTLISVTYTLAAGTYKWVDNPYVTIDADENISFISAEQTFSRLLIRSGARYSIKYDSEGAYQEPLSSWFDPRYQIITLESDQTVSEEFYTWAITGKQLIPQTTQIKLISTGNKYFKTKSGKYLSL